MRGGKKLKKSLIQFIFMNCLHWGMWKGFNDMAEPDPSHKNY
jgi:hypothetical protein